MVKQIIERWYAHCRISKAICLIGLLVVFSLGSHGYAQDDLLSGYWKQDGKSVYIKVINLDGVYHAEVIRDDWSPGLVGSTYFNNVTNSGKQGRWSGDAPVFGEDRVLKATLKITRDDELSVKIRRGSKLLWLRSEEVEKRY